MKRPKLFIPVLLLAFSMPVISTGCVPVLLGVGTIVLIDNLAKKNKRAANARRSEQARRAAAKRRIVKEEKCKPIGVQEIDQGDR